MRWTALDSPVGELWLAADEAGLCTVRFGARDGLPGGADGFGAAEGWLDTAAAQLGRYFAGELTSFEVPLSTPGGDDFQRAVWAEIARIPYGETQTYGAIAAAVGEHDPLAAQAVGVACNRNPLPLVVPCHRVVGAGGKLVGYGGGLPRKRFLLELEAGVAMARAWR